jgi:hypothetical protein
LHKARAQVALSMHDQTAFDRHLAAMEERFRATKNFALIAQAGRLAKLAVRPERPNLGPLQGSSLPAVSALTQRVRSDIESSADPCDVALRLIVRESRAEGGHLYLFRDGRLELAAASSQSEPPIELEQRLLSDVQRVQRGLLDEEDDMTVGLEQPQNDNAALGAVQSVFMESLSPAADSGEQLGQYRVMVLNTRREGEAVVVGGVIVKLRPDGTFNVQSDLLESIASVLLERVGMPTTARALA